METRSTRWKIQPSLPDDSAHGDVPFGCDVYELDKKGGFVNEALDMQADEPWVALLRDSKHKVFVRLKRVMGVWHGSKLDARSCDDVWVWQEL